MLDTKLLREDSAFVAVRLKDRGFILNTLELAMLEELRKNNQTATQELQNKRNVLSKKIGQQKAQGQDVIALVAEVNQLNKELKEREQSLHRVLSDLQCIYEQIPNLTDSSVPRGNSEEDNVEIRRWGEAKQFDFVPKDHVDLAQALGYMDFELAAKIATARFVVLQGPLARLHRALVQFMLDIHINEHGYQEIYVPYLVNHDSLYGTGQLPKFAEDQFRIAGEQHLYLTPTAEVPVTNIARDRIFSAEELPQKFVCHTPCFRSEAGSYGRDTRGMIRQHQFEKVELVHFSKPENSWQTLEQLTSAAETILQRLQLPYRVMVLCTGDIGFSAAKTYDLEVWLPGQNKYREISSCSNCTDFQARRLQARWRNPSTNKLELIHTLNGSGLAVGRTLVAILENYQDKDGKIHIPPALHPYMNGITEIG
jgi:seryl-tRNA synthetase